MKVLIVDDNQVLLECLTEALRLKGFSAHGLNDPSKALKTYRRGDIDAVISDFSMPGMNGIEVLNAIKKYDLDAKVMIMTGIGDMRIKSEAYRSGACAFFNKPLDLDKIIFELTRIEITDNELNRRSG